MSIVRTYLVAALAALCLAAGAVGWWQAYELRSTDAAENQALVDASATAEVQDAVGRALTSVLSYDYSRPDDSRAAAEKVLAGDARQQYDTLLDALVKRAGKQKLVLTTQVQAVAVKELHDDHAKLLVFLDQSSKRVDDKEASVSAAQLSISAERSGDTWRITELLPL